MPGKRVSMRKTREVLRLYFELKLGQRQIARSANVSQSTVHEYLTRFTAAGLSWPLPAEMSEAELEAALFPTAPSQGSEPGAPRSLPDFAHLHEELQRHKHTIRKRPKCTVLPSVHESVRCTLRQDWSRCSRAATPRCG